MRRIQCPCCDGRGTIPPLVNSEQVRKMLNIRYPSTLWRMINPNHRNFVAGFPKPVKPNWPGGYRWYRKDINKYIKEAAE